MPRNSSGTMSAPAGQPAVSGTVISSSVFNALVADLIAELTDSLSRSGKGGMTAVLRVVDGAVAAPAHSFTLEVGSGLYRAGAGDVRLAVSGVDALKLIAGGLDGLNLKGSSIVAATATNAQLQLQGNRTAADAGPDVAAVPSVTRTAGIVFQVYNNGARLNVDFQGLLQLASQAAAIQPASLWTAITPNANWTANNGLAYWKDALGIVHFKGYLTQVGATNPAFTLPVGFRPGATRVFRTAKEVLTDAYVVVLATGDVRGWDGAGVVSNAYMDPVSFLAEG